MYHAFFSCTHTKKYNFCKTPPYQKKKKSQHQEQQWKRKLLNCPWAFCLSRHARKINWKWNTQHRIQCSELGTHLVHIVQMPGGITCSLMQLAILMTWMKASLGQCKWPNKMKKIIKHQLNIQTKIKSTPCKKLTLLFFLQPNGNYIKKVLIMTLILTTRSSTTNKLLQKTIIL